jgi:hypothetical protein
MDKLGSNAWNKLKAKTKVQRKFKVDLKAKPQLQLQKSQEEVG